MEPRFITLGELAERTGLPSAWLQREADAGRVPCIRAGRQRRFDMEAVLHSLTKQRDREGAPRAK